MDLALNAADQHLFTKYSIYPGDWTEDYWLRQILSLCAILYIGAMVSYFIFSPLAYFFVFDHRLKKHPFFLKNQIRREIMQSTTNGTVLAILSAAMVLPEVRGYAKLYTLDETGSTGFQAFFLIVRDILGLIFFSDFLIYWIHRWLHHRLIYRHLHKQHHTWKIPTPFASYAFHPLDGFMQSVPYHIYPYLFPLNKHAYLILFVLVTLWAVSIHDGDYRVPAILRPYINGSAHHTDHHLYYNYNYGQYFTLWDRLGGSYRTPSVYEGNSLVDAVIEKKSRQSKKGNNPEKVHKG